MKTTYVSLIIALFIFLMTPRVVMQALEDRDSFESNSSAESENKTYILYWNYAMPDMECPKCNSVITTNRTILGGDYTNFEIVLLFGVNMIGQLYLPQKRSRHQRYVYISVEPASYHPVCYRSYDKYYNWTLTYKLDSSHSIGYIDVKNDKGEVIGPKIDMEWMAPRNESIKNELMEIFRNKTKPVAWFVSNCNAMSGRDVWIKELSVALTKYNMSVDIYGECGKLVCKHNCDEMLERDYFFYLSFESASCEDYVTEKFLRPLQHNTIPIVYGGANYSRFAPERSYINARDVTSGALAETIYNLTNDIQAYSQYFWWKPYYSFSPRSQSLCEICTLINKDPNLERHSIIYDFVDWWSPDCKFDKITISIDTTHLEYAAASFIVLFLYFMFLG